MPDTVGMQTLRDLISRLAYGRWPTPAMNVCVGSHFEERTVRKSNSRRERMPVQSTNFWVWRTTLMRKRDYRLIPRQRRSTRRRLIVTLHRPKRCGGDAILATVFTMHSNVQRAGLLSEFPSRQFFLRSRLRLGRDSRRSGLLGRQMAHAPESEIPRLSPCLRCRVAYRLVGIEGTDKPDHDLYTFECPDCGHLEVRTIYIE
jgi:hypothetical protein